MLFILAVWIKLMMSAARSPAAKLPLKSQFLRSCESSHERKAWLFAGSELAGQRAAIVMSLVQSAKMHGHDPWAYLKDVLTRLPSHLNSRIDELLPHRWQPQV